jgi:hypothetical protein
MKVTVRTSSEKRCTTLAHELQLPVPETMATLNLRIDRLLDLALADSFPASDPLSTMRSSGP